MITRFGAILGLLYLCCGTLTFVAADPLESSFSNEAAPVFKQFCFDCHGDKRAKARLNLQRLSAAPDFPAHFKSWEKVMEMLEKKEMPPEDEPQPSPAQRSQLIATVRGALDGFIRENAGDPGRVALRRLTSAEIAYSIEDHTGLRLGLERNFISDAVGGEGFSNVGDVQFIQDSTLEQYLQAARQVATHAVIGAGPLRFSPTPGQTGQELDAIARIQSIYQKHGFRTASGEGGKAFGLEHYPKAFYAAWGFAHRAQLGSPDATLPSFAHAEGLDAPFVQYVWDSLHNRSLPFPLNQIRLAWEKLPAAPTDTAAVRTACDRLYEVLRLWQTSFAENTGDAEVASLLTETSFKPALTNSFRIRLAWPEGQTNGTFELALTRIAGLTTSNKIVWHSPALRFRKRGQAPGRSPATPLRMLLLNPTTLNFSSDSTNDVVTSTQDNLAIQFSIPSGFTQADLILDASLLATADEDCVVRCVVTHHLREGATDAATDSFSFLLANPTGPGVAMLKSGVAEFARRFPQISQREAAPADRDPIPPAFDNSYNNPERNEFHATIKYFRDDSFLTDHILEDATRQELNAAWADLLTSFEYHDLSLRLLQKKFAFKVEGGIAALDNAHIEQIPAEPRPFLRALARDYHRALELRRGAESSHVEEVLHLAQLAWRRPLAHDEVDRLRAFYTRARHDQDHAAAIRSLITRVLTAPAFLYRLEGLDVASASPAANSGRVPLNDWELASRLSHFLWSTIPDEPLRQAAAAGQLHTAESLVHHAERMLRDPKARRFATEFFGQWFGFYRFDGYRGVDTTRFTEFTDDLKSDMYEEAVSFFDYIVREDRPVSEILFADYTFLNRPLAEHYNIPAPELSTNDLTRVDRLNRFRRGGLLRLGAVLTSTSAPLRTSAVKRGDWILRRILSQPVPPPPGDAGSIPPDDVLADGKTVRERLEAHRRNPSCVNCHARMDPLGFALEHFDSIGRWRDTYRDGQKIDASGRLNDGSEISEFEGLDQYLRSHQSLFERTLCAKLLGYALGRSELVSDRPLVDQMSQTLKRDPRFSVLIKQIVASPQFRFRRASPENQPKTVAAAAQ